MRGVWRDLRDHPLQLRVTVLTTAGVALAVVVFSMVGYLALGSTLRHASETIALTAAQQLAGPAGADIATTGGLTPRLGQVGDVVVEAVDTQGLVLRVPGEQRQLVLTAGDRSAAGADGAALTRSGRLADGAAYAFAATPVPGTDFALVVARSLGPVHTVLAAQRGILLGICLAGILTSAVLGLVIAQTGLRPMRRLTEAVEHVTATQDLRPVSVPYARGDLVALAAAFNLMLLSLTRVKERQTRLVADAGHDLRTPLTSLRTNVDLLRTDLQAGRLSVAQRGAVLADVDAQLAELGDMIGDFVHVLREDTAVVLVTLDFRDVVRTAVDKVSHRAQGRTFAVALDPLYLVGNAEQLVRVVTNLLDNAVKWSPPTGVIRVRLHGNRFSVADSGPGIAEADLPFIFDRYFRGESGRKTKGTGLGLSIVAKTVEELGGTVTAGRSDDGGAEFTLQLPGVTTREAASTLLVPASTPTSTPAPAHA